MISRRGYTQLIDVAARAAAWRKDVDFDNRILTVSRSKTAKQGECRHKTIHMTVGYAPLTPQHKLSAVQRLCDTGNAAPDEATAATTTTTACEGVAENSTEAN